jgi:hypothetical protein
VRSNNHSFYVLLLAKSMKNQFSEIAVKSAECWKNSENSQHSTHNEEKCGERE